VQEIAAAQWLGASGPAAAIRIALP